MSEESHLRYCLRRSRETSVTVLGVSLLMLIASFYRVQHPLHRSMTAWDYASYLVSAGVLLYLMRVFRCRQERLLLGFVATEQVLKPFVSELPLSAVQTAGRFFIVALWAGATITSAILITHPLGKD
jgi:hypothetical protein